MAIVKLGENKWISNEEISLFTDSAGNPDHPSLFLSHVQSLICFSFILVVIECVK